MLDSIESAIEDIKNGKMVIVVDDEDRENEGDFITAAQNVTPEIINFMSTHGRGLICAPLSEERCDELNLQAMVSDNTSLHATPFTVSIDLLGNGCTTGISAHDRAKTVQALVDPNTKPEHGRVFLDVIPYTLRLPQQANWADIEEICDEELQRAFYGDATVLEAMQSAVSRTLPLFIENE